MTDDLRRLTTVTPLTQCWTLPKLMWWPKTLKTQDFSGPKWPLPEDPIHLLLPER